jgi:hypothetical protein
MTKTLTALTNSFLYFCLHSIVFISPAN